MSNLLYERKSDEHKLNNYSNIFLKSDIYHVTSLYDNENLKNAFLMLKSNIVDMDTATVTKCIQGTEQDFAQLMAKARDYINYSLRLEGSSVADILLDLFSDCVFGYYILTPLIKAKEVSDIKVYAWDRITVKANGNRYLTDLKFASPDDYEKWLERIIRIHRLQLDELNSLQHCTDRRGVEEYYLRIDLELKYIVSTEVNNIHIRKIPKEKYSWDYLISAGMLDNDMKIYIQDRIINNYGFLLSGKGGSGKTSLLNNMLDEIPFNESVLVSQESDELYSAVHPQIQFEHTMAIKRNNKTFEYSLEDELRLGLLQDIDRFVIGEIKGPEALYVFTTGVNTGATFMGTLHSNSAASSVRRLAQLAKYVSDYSIEALEEMLSSVPFSLIHMSHFSIDEILEIEGWSNKTQQLVFKNVFNKNEIRK